jgi:outer membrane protein assembly factor BamB
MYRTDADPDRPVLVVAFNGRVFGLDARTGQRQWSHDITPGHGEVELVVQSGKLFAAVGRTLLCIAYPTGELLGKTTLPGTYQSRPTMMVNGDLLYVASGGELTCLDASGKPLWHEPFVGKGIGSIALGFPGDVRQADDVGSK